MKAIKNQGLGIRKGGQAMLLATIFFLFISLTIVFGMVTPIVNHVKQVTLSNNSKQSYILAEALIEDALYRLNNGKSLPANYSLTLNGGTASASVISNSNSKKVNTEADTSNIIRSISSTFVKGAGIAFNYGVQAGRGGIVLTGSGTTIFGNAYSNGNISNGGKITGTAVAANTSALVADQTNATPLPPSSSINIRNASTNEDFGQSFRVSTSSPINKIQFYIKKVGSPGDATVRIVTDNGGSPSTTNLLSTQGNLSASLITPNYGWVNVVFSSNPTLSPGTTYWVVIDNGSTSGSAYYVVGANTGAYAYPAKVGKYTGTWNNTSPSGLSSYFNLFLGGLTSTINGGGFVGEGSTGDAWAHTVNDMKVAGHLYCQTGSGNNKACDSSMGDPGPQPFPISDANIQEWKDQAADGGTLSSYSLGGVGSLGPKKISGNMTLSGGAHLTLTGNVWVTGNINSSGGSIIDVDPSYGSGGAALIADGTINISGGGTLDGTGDPSSFLLLITTSDTGGTTCSSPYALTFSGGSGAVVLSAQNGSMNLSGGGGLNEATADLLCASGGTEITYTSGLINASFSTGPSGSWTISNWQEVP